MKKIARPMIVLAACSCLIAACTSIKMDSWTDPEFEGRNIGKTVIIAVDVSDSVRRRYEDHFVSQLAAAGLAATASYSVLPKEEKLTKEEVDQVVQELKADSVIVTRVVGEKDKIRYEQPVRYPSHYGSFYGMYDWSYTYTHGPGYVSNYLETYLETNLYDAETRKLIWSGQKSVTDDRSEKKNIASIVKAVISDLRKQGMIGTSGK